MVSIKEIVFVMFRLEINQDLLANAHHASTLTNSIMRLKESYHRFRTFSFMNEIERITKKRSREEAGSDDEDNFKQKSDFEARLVLCIQSKFIDDYNNEQILTRTNNGLTRQCQSLKNETEKGDEGLEFLDIGPDASFLGLYKAKESM